MQKGRKMIKRMHIAPAHCAYCESKTEPSVTDVSNVSRYISERGMIVSRERSGLCSKHQKAMTKVVKHARFLGVLPYLARA